MVKQQRSTSQSGRHCLGVERPNTKRHLATGKSHGDNARTRWRNTSRKGKNGLRHVRSPRFRSRTRFFSVVFFFDFSRSGFRQRELPLSHKLMYWPYWQHFSLQFQSQFQRRWEKTSINWCLRKPLMPPLCPCSMLPMLLQLSRWFENRQNCNKNLTLLSNNVKLRRALLTN